VAVESGLNSYIPQMTKYAPKEFLRFSWRSPVDVDKAIDFVRAPKRLATEYGLHMTDPSSGSSRFHADESKGSNDED
jgi:hypothetical protein